MEEKENIAPVNVDLNIAENEVKDIQSLILYNKRKTSDVR